MAELLIYTPDGKKQTLALSTERLTIGRSAAADLCYSEDNGLSRLHVAFERTPNGFLLRDLNSKNGTIVNGKKVNGAQNLTQNDKISCGHLLIVYDPPKRGSGVVFIRDENERTSSSTIVTSLGGILNEARQAGGAAAQLSALIQAGNELSGERPLPELFKLILDLAIDAVSAGRGLLLLMENGELVEAASRGENFTISGAVRDRVLESKLSVLVRDTTLDEAFRQRQSIIAARVQTLMAAPLQSRDGVIGLIYVDSPSLHREFSKDDLSLLTVMASVATIRIERTRHAELEQARKLLQRELEQAEAIQRQALPRGAPDVPGLEMAGYNAASRTVGGDYYDYFPDGHGRVGLIVADVSGKGMAAALMVMALQARVQSVFEDLPVAPGALKKAMDRLNHLTAANCPEGRFITVFTCIADGNSGRLDWACAGHNPPIIVRANGTYELLRDGGPMMGIFPRLEFAQFEAHLEPGDLLAIYSDGVTETCSPDDHEFDVPELAKVLVQNRRKPVTEVLDIVAALLRKWTQDVPPADDITLVLARKL